MTYRSRYIRPADPRLGRHVNHDPQSRRFAHRSSALIRSVRHFRHAPIWDQGTLGSCTGNAALGVLHTDPFWQTADAGELASWPPVESTAVRIYSQATAIDNFGGTYPPEDTGSDGLSVAKVLKEAGLIAGYTHAFTLSDFLSGLVETPCIVGTEWREGMFNTDAAGVLHPTGAAAGGHEYVADQVVQVGDPFGPAGLPCQEPVIGFTNSWGTGWGLGGRFFMRASEFGELLAADGDATFFTPAGLPAPQPDAVPEPESAADRELREAFERWLAAKDA